MSDIQELLKDLAAALRGNMITEDMCIGLCDALNGVPTEFHQSAFRAFVKEAAENA